MTLRGGTAPPLNTASTPTSHNASPYTHTASPSSPPRRSASAGTFPAASASRASPHSAASKKTSQGRSTFSESLAEQSKKLGELDGLVRKVAQNVSEYAFDDAQGGQSSACGSACGQASSADAGGPPRRSASAQDIFATADKIRRMQLELEIGARDAYLSKRAQRQRERECAQHTHETAPPLPPSLPPRVLKMSPPPEATTLYTALMLLLNALLLCFTALLPSLPPRVLKMSLPPQATILIYIDNAKRHAASATHKHARKHTRTRWKRRLRLRRGSGYWREISIWREILEHTASATHRHARKNTKTRWKKRQRQPHD